MRSNLLYNDYMERYPDCGYTYNDWYEKILKERHMNYMRDNGVICSEEEFIGIMFVPIEDKDFTIGDDVDLIGDWDNTLLDGLSDWEDI